MKCKIRNMLASIKQLLILYLCLIYDAKYFTKYSSIFCEYNSQEKLSARIAMATHGLEKGLTMYNRRLGFGATAINRIVTLCTEYIQRNYDQSDVIFTHAVAVLDEYVRLHKHSGYKLDIVILNQIETLTQKISFNSTSQISTNKKEFLKSQFSAFDLFCTSRHSVREFIKDSKVNIELLKKAVELAQTAPSSCNRQTSRVHIIDNYDIKHQILDLQQGNRGFGYLCDKIIIITTNIGGYASGRERNAGQVDGGIFGMNLLYGLHFYGIGACTLNCYFTPTTKKKLHKLCHIKQEEDFVMMILIGNIPDKFNIARSARQQTNKIMTIN